MSTEENSITETVPEEETVLPAEETAEESAPAETVPEPDLPAEAPGPEPAAETPAETGAEAPEAAPVRERTPEERDREIRSFLKAYPEMRDLGAVPAEVWAAVAGGETLLEAWRAHEISLLKAEAETLRREKEDLERRESNRARSTGSQRGSASDAGGFEALWYDGN